MSDENISLETKQRRLDGMIDSAYDILYYCEPSTGAWKDAHDIIDRLQLMLYKVNKRIARGEI